MSQLEVDLLDASRELQRRLEASTSAEHRKRRGQFFTPAPICRFMAKLLSFPAKSFRLLDPGAGVGALTAAVCEELCRLDSPRHFEAHLFENDPQTVELLERNMERCRLAVEAAGHEMAYFVHATDFIAEAGEDFDKSRRLFREGDALGHFDGIIMNPPYFKIAKNSAHAKLMAAVVHGQPNIYALFLALAAHRLRPGGELVAITPRSFCNGLYFRDFRKWFLRRMSLEHLHLFESRSETFQGEDVLQESVITVSRRCDNQSDTVKITSSSGTDTHLAPHQMVPVARIIESPASDCLIRIPTNKKDVETIDLIESLPMRFAETGLRISTGPVVLFRAKEFLLEDPHGRASVPLLMPHNVKPFEVAWPIRKQRKPCAFQTCPASQRLLLPARNYVLVKRFSAKEERRRLTAGCFVAKRQQNGFVAVENHVNYIYHERRELSENETFGVAALLNSTLFDRYFRLISGSTQVNATELRTLKFPGLDMVETLGKRVLQSWPLGHLALEEIVLETIASAVASPTIFAESLN